MFLQRKEGGVVNAEANRDLFFIYVLTKGRLSMVDIRLSYSLWETNFRRNESFVVPQFPNTQVTLAFPT